MTPDAILKYFPDELFRQNIPPERFQAPAAGLLVHNGKPRGVPAQSGILIGWLAVSWVFIGPIGKGGLDRQEFHTQKMFKDYFLQFLYYSNATQFSFH